MRGAALALALSAACAACGGHAPAPPAAPAPAPLHLAPLADLVPAAGLEWLVDARPREIAGNEAMIPVIHALVREERLTALAAKSGGLDLREMDELAVARYADTTLYLARARLDPGRVEQAFAAHVVAVDGRAVDREDKDARGRIVRAWGEAGESREQIAMFGADAAGLEVGRFGPLRAAELFAEGRLKRAQPALHAAPLARAAEILGDASLRAFAPGPFRGEWSKGLGGLLAGATAVAVSARFPAPPPGAAWPATSAPVAFEVALLGAWNEDAPAAAERLGAAWGALTASPLGRVCGLDRPLVAPTTRPTPDAVSLRVTLDAALLARGLHDVLDAQVDEIMQHAGPPPPGPLTPPPKQ